MEFDLKNSLGYIETGVPNFDDKSQKEESLFKKRKDYSKYTLKSLKGRRYTLNTNARTYFVIWSSLVVSCWLWKVGEILVNNNEKYCLSDSVLNTLLTTTTIQVLGLVAIAMYDLFNGKSEDKINNADK